MAVVFFVGLILVIAGLAEGCLHRRRLRRIPIRIHVNGTRGKSTTTRLIAAGLRAGGFKVVAKTTGTAPRVIMDDGTETALFRLGRPNIMEQVRLIGRAARRGADAVVLECMALHPENQWVSETKMIRATIGVITNVREDHLDVMGPGLEDSARVLSLTIPRSGKLVTAERDFLELFRERARELGTTLYQVSPDDGEAAAGIFSPSQPHLIFEENLACALKVCELAGVERGIALRGMQTAAMDPGTARIYRWTGARGGYVLVNAFAANDPLSTEQIWHRYLALESACRRPDVAIMNNRLDRSQRILGLAEMLACRIKPGRIVLVGEAASFAARRLVHCGLDKACIVSMAGSRRRPEAILRAVENLIPGGGVILALGNTKGIGSAIMEYCEKRDNILIRNGEEQSC